MGGKFGFTPEAHQTLAAVFGVNMSEYSARPIAIILLRSNDRRRDALLIMDRIRKNFVYGTTFIDKKMFGPFQDIHVGTNAFEALKTSGIK